MKTITKTYKVFASCDNSSKAKDNARQKWNEDNDYPFLTDDLREYIHEELNERGFTELNTITPLYSLSYCQGDGLMFEGTIQDKKGNVYTIKQSGHYYHERSTNIEGKNKNGEYIETEKFENDIYIPICVAVRDRGYNEIEAEESEENFANTCEANGYTFLEDGTIFNQ